MTRRLPRAQGGSHFFPNDAVDHANYAFTQFYHAHLDSGYDTCFFGGNRSMCQSVWRHCKFPRCIWTRDAV